MLNAFRVLLTIHPLSDRDFPGRRCSTELAYADRSIDGPDEHTRSYKQQRFNRRRWSRPAQANQV